MKLLLMKLLCSLIRPYGRGVNEALTATYTMSKELVLVALRVLACLVVRRQDPAPEDVARLRQAVAAEERDWEVETLAAYIT
jgi:hypothetical protein